MAVLKAGASPEPESDVADWGERFKILLIDDDKKFCRLIASFLAPHGYLLTTIHDGVNAFECVAREHWHLVILDVMLPGMDGFELVKKVRSISSVPILMLTARGDEADRIVGLELGADDYVPKTFSSRELLARIRALLRRTAGAVAAKTAAATAISTIELTAAIDETLLTVGELKIYLDGYRVFISNNELFLTHVEFNLLVSLARARGRARSREQLLSEVRDREPGLNDRSIDVHVSMLRKKLSKGSGDAQYIRTVRNIGYMLIDPANPAP